MSGDQFKAGDVVRLRSGGPRMSVEAVDKNGHMHCRWWNFNHHKLESELFTVASIFVKDDSGRD